MEGWVERDGGVGGEGWRGGWRGMEGWVERDGGVGGEGGWVERDGGVGGEGGWVERDGGVGGWSWDGDGGGWRCLHRIQLLVARLRH